MANRLIEKKDSALTIMAERIQIDPKKLHATLKNTVFKGATDDEMLTLVVVANQHKLNPLQKEIYAFPSRGGGIVPVISVDGWIKIMNSHPNMNGIHFNTTIDEKGAPISCAATIWVKGRDNPCVITEFFSECYRNTEPWNQYPHRMLRWKALSQGVRIAFGFAGYSDGDGDSEAAADPSETKPVFNESPGDTKLPLFTEAEDSPPGAEMETADVAEPETVGA